MKATIVRAADIHRCAAGLLRFAAPDEADALVADPLTRDAAVSYGTLNRPVADAMLRRPGEKRLPPAAQLLDPVASLLGQLLDLDDPQVNGELFLSEEMPRNLRRQLAHQTSRRDGVTPLPLPPDVLDKAVTQRHQSLLHAADPGTAARALRSLGRGADPHGAVRACRTLLDAGRTGELAELVERGALPEFRWGPGRSEPSVSAYVRAALTSEAGAARLRELSERVRRPEWLRTASELADAAACAPSGDGGPVRTVVHGRHPSIPRVDWQALLDAEPERRRREGPLPYQAARLIAQRTDVPDDLLLLAVADHPELAPLVPSPSPALFALVLDHLTVVGAGALVKVAGNGQVAGTLTVEEIAAALPPEALDRYAESLWLPGLRGTAAVRTMLGRDGDVPLRPFVTGETGSGPRRGLRIPGERAHWDAQTIYGRRVASALRERGELTADEVLSLVSPDAVLAPRNGVMPDLRVLRRLAELVHRHLGGRPEAWTAALRLLEEGYVGTLPELLATAGEIAHQGATR